MITLGNGGRVTVERLLALTELRALVAQLDPSAALLLVEGSAEHGVPCVELAPDPDRIAVVAPGEVAGDFARAAGQPGVERGAVSPPLVAAPGSETVGAGTRHAASAGDAGARAGGRVQ